MTSEPITVTPYLLASLLTSSVTPVSYTHLDVYKRQDLYYIILDEVQLLDDFVDVLNGFLHIKNADVYVTGSNSKFLSSDVVTEFRGRGDEIHMLPLSFREFVTV